jgi:hypothetical protein
MFLAGGFRGHDVSSCWLISKLPSFFGSSSAPTDRTTKKTLPLLERLGNVLGADPTDLFMILNP